MELVTQAEKDLREVYNILITIVHFSYNWCSRSICRDSDEQSVKKAKALYLNSGHWSATAAKEARNFAEIDEITIIEKWRTDSNYRS